MEMSEKRVERARSFLQRAVESLEEKGASDGSPDRSGTRPRRSEDPGTSTTETRGTPSTSLVKNRQSRIANVIGERNRLFHFTGRNPPASRPKSKRKKVNMWTHDFICLAKTGTAKPPSSLETGELLRAGLGKKHLSFFESGTSGEVHEEILQAFPQLSEGGGYELLRVGDTGGQRSQLRVIPPPSQGYTVGYLKEVLRQAKVYVRPLQKDLSLQQEDLTVDGGYTDCPKERCNTCGSGFPLSQLPKHVEECQELKRAIRERSPTPIPSDDSEELEEPLFRVVSQRGRPKPTPIPDDSEELEEPPFRASQRGHSKPTPILPDDSVRGPK